MFLTRLPTAFVYCVLGILPFADPTFAENPENLQIEMPNVRSLAISPDGKILAAGGWVSTLNDGGGRLDHGIVKLWDMTTGSELATLRHSGYRETESGSSFRSNVVRELQFSPDGKSLFAGDQLGFAVWDLSTKQQMWHSDVGLTRNLEISPDGKLLAVPTSSSSPEGLTGTKLIDLPTRRKKSHFPRGRSGVIYDIAFSPDGKLLATAGSDCKVTVWNVEDESSVYLDRIGWTLNAVSYSPNGQTIVCAGEGGVVKLYEVIRKDEEVTIKKRNSPAHNRRTTYRLIYSPDGQRLFDVGDEFRAEDRIRVWNTETWQTTAVLDGNCMTLSHDGKTIAVSNRKQGTITVGEVSELLEAAETSSPD